MQVSKFLYPSSLTLHCKKKEKKAMGCLNSCLPASTHQHQGSLLCAEVRSVNLFHDYRWIFTCSHQFILGLWLVVLEHQSSPAISDQCNLGALLNQFLKCSEGVCAGVGGAEFFFYISCGNFTLLRFYIGGVFLWGSTRKIHVQVR